MRRESKLLQLIEPAVRIHGLDLWGLEYNSGGNHALLRVYIDGPDGVSVENCAAVSRQISSVLDVEDPIAKQYTLEVSSPGLNRPLFKINQYQEFIGAGVKLRLRVPFEGKRSVTGLLGGIEGDDVVVVVGEEEFVLPFDCIERANVVGVPGGVN